MDELLIYFNQDFQKKVFTQIIQYYGSSFKVAEVLKSKPSTIRSYKNLHSKYIPKKLIDKMVKLSLINNKQIIENTIGIVNKTKNINEILNTGREKRKRILKEFKKEIPKIGEVVIDNKLRVSKWFEKYYFLASQGFHKIKVEEDKTFLRLSYNCFNKTKIKEFNVKVPKTIQINDNFLYFFGLWCGDNAGGKRLGICNKNKAIISYTEQYLTENQQKVEKILCITKNVRIPKIDYDKISIIKSKVHGWALSVHTNNGVLASFFIYLKQNLAEFLNLVNHKEVFFSGLFDAEGNVSLYNRSLRWACKDRNRVKIYREVLNQIGFSNTYDGGSIVTYNKKRFLSEILPYLKHTEKSKDAEFLCSGEGRIPKNYRKTLNLVKNSSCLTHKDIAKALKKTKIYEEIKLLSDFGYIAHEGYPHKYKITERGLKSLGGQNHNSDKMPKLWKASSSPLGRVQRKSC